MMRTLISRLKRFSITFFVTVCLMDAAAASDLQNISKNAQQAIEEARKKFLLQAPHPETSRYAVMSAAGPENFYTGWLWRNTVHGPRF
jgi:hypothetical protein